MKRSEINGIIRDGLAFLREHRFLLPRFAMWTPDHWKRKGPECAGIARRQLGWDITDFGSGKFHEYGLFSFTIRNGTFQELRKENGKVFAEKILITGEKQVNPTNFHYQKMEDIINRGCGDLIIRLWNSTTDEKLADTEVDVPAGGTIVLEPEDSVCLPAAVPLVLGAGGQRHGACRRGEPGERRLRGQQVLRKGGGASRRSKAIAMHLACEKYGHYPLDLF